MGKDVKVELMQISNEYLAGLLDGDGCFFISRRNNHHMRRAYRSEVNITLRRDKRILLEAIRDKYGGYLADRTPRPPTKPVTRLDWSGASAGEISELLMPFLLLKRDQAAILIEFEKLRDCWSPYLSVRDDNGRLRGFGDDYYIEAERMYLKCRELKRMKNPN